MSNYFEELSLEMHIKHIELLYELSSYHKLQTLVVKTNLRSCAALSGHLKHEDQIVVALNCVFALARLPMSRLPYLLVYRMGFLSQQISLRSILGLCNLPIR